MVTPGTIAVVVGPSGAGKDSIIDYVRARLKGDSRFSFVRRYITRPQNAGGEDHAAVDHAGFSQLAAAGQLALHWQAHGLFYGIPAATLDDLGKGKTLIANGSRSAIPVFREVYGDRLRIVHVTAPKEVLAARLAARGRESEDSVLQRLERSVESHELADVDLVVVNDGALSEAGERLLAYLKGLDCEPPQLAPSTT